MRAAVKKIKCVSERFCTLRIASEQRKESGFRGPPSPPTLPGREEPFSVATTRCEPQQCSCTQSSSPVFISLSSRALDASSCLAGCPAGNVPAGGCSFKSPPVGSVGHRTVGFAPTPPSCSIQLWRPKNRAVITSLPRQSRGRLPLSVSPLQQS